MYASECCNTTVATERAGYVLYRALVLYIATCTCTCISTTKCSMQCLVCGPAHVFSGYEAILQAVVCKPSLLDSDKSPIWNPYTVSTYTFLHRLMFRFFTVVML